MFDFGFTKPLEPAYQANILVNLAYDENGIVASVKASKEDTLKPVLTAREMNKFLKDWSKEKTGYGITERLIEGLAERVAEAFYGHEGTSILEESKVEGDSGYAKVNIRRY